MHKEFGWLRDLLTQQPPPPAAPRPSAPLNTQLQFMLTGWKQTRCLLPYRHPPDKCPGYHVLSGGNSAVLVFDARRPPVKGGQQVYAAEWCK